MTITPAIDDITIYKGATYRAKYTIYYEDESGEETEYDFDGYQARAQGREEYGSAEPFFDLTTENGGITLTGGVIEFLIDDAVTEEITADGGVWDVKLFAPNGDVDIFIMGKVCVAEVATHD